MSANVMVAVRAGLTRGVIEFRQTLTNRQETLGNLMAPAIFLAVSYFQRNDIVNGTGVSNGAIMMASVAGFSLVMGGAVTTAQMLGTEREDGTLLRAKALPKGMLGYLIGKSVQVTLVAALNVALILVGGMLLIDGVALNGPGALVTVVWVVALGVLATAPFGAIAGSLMSNPRTSVGLLMLPVVGVTMVSGVFFPITVLPGWVQAIGQLFPVYWLGLGMRSALLPDSMLTSEIAESWRHLETVGVLGTWAVVGLLVALVVLRRMARRESGSRVEAARQRAMQRVT